jgi:hypothetical protein
VAARTHTRQRLREKIAIREKLIQRKTGVENGNGVSDHFIDGYWI